MGKLSAAFKEKVVLVTGASSGIGEALARELVSHGASVVLAARRIGQLQSLVDEFTKKGGAAIAVACDVTRDGDLERVVAQAIEKFGRLDVAIANAGFGVVGRVEKLTLEDYRRQFETNVFGVLRTVYACLPELKKTRGRIALMGSVSGHVALPVSSPYSMSKYSVRALAEAFADEMKPYGVAVTLLSPGFVESEIRQVDNQGKWHAKAKDPLPAWLPVPASVAAKEMLRAIADRRREKIITFHGKCIVFIQRHFPALIDWIKGRGMAGRPEPKTSE